MNEESTLPKIDPAEVNAAIDASREHWHRLRSGTSAPEEGIFSNHCALCDLFNNMARPEGNRNCVGCPVRAVTGKPNCDDSPWSDVFRYYQHLIKTGHSFAIIKATIEFQRLAGLQYHFLNSLEKLPTFDITKPLITVGGEPGELVCSDISDDDGEIAKYPYAVRVNGRTRCYNQDGKLVAGRSNPFDLVNSVEKAKPEPATPQEFTSKLRYTEIEEWTAEEVPVTAIFSKLLNYPFNRRHWYRAVSVSTNYVKLDSCYCSFRDLLDQFIYSLDEGETWMSCGKVKATGARPAAFKI